jgi:hypothetical protein
VGRRPRGHHDTTMPLDAICAGGGYGLKTDAREVVSSLLWLTRGGRWRARLMQQRHGQTSRTGVTGGAVAAEGMVANNVFDEGNTCARSCGKCTGPKKHAATWDRCWRLQERHTAACDQDDGFERSIAQCRCAAVELGDR